VLVVSGPQESHTGIDGSLVRPECGSTLRGIPACSAAYSRRYLYLDRISENAETREIHLQDGLTPSDISWVRAKPRVLQFDQLREKCLVNSTNGPTPDRGTYCHAVRSLVER